MIFIPFFFIKMACVCEALASVEQAIESDSEFSDLEEELEQDAEEDESQGQFTRSMYQLNGYISVHAIMMGV